MSFLLRTLIYVVGAGAMTLPATRASDDLFGPYCTSFSNPAVSKAERVRGFLSLKNAYVASPLPIVKASFISSAAAAETDRSPDAGPVISEPPKLAPTARIFERLSTPAPAAALALRPTTEAREVNYDLDVKYADGQIWNPTTQSQDHVRLRSYASMAGASSTFISPAIEVNPGQTIRITLHNHLPPDPSCAPKVGGADMPSCFNGTNLHSHGLWINPAGNGDNVLLSINPGVSFQYEYNIPPDHPAGTFWYHSHRHGSTALQVSSGMAGALIVRGSRLPTAQDNGDLDTLLKPSNAQPFPERTMVFQQIQYACRDSKGQIETTDKGAYVCKPNEVGGIEDFDQFGPNTWGPSGRFTSINGVVLGHLDDAVAGRTERWRMIHGGVRDTISLQVLKRAPGAADPKNLKAADAQAYVQTNCVGQPIPLHLVAADGLTKASVQTVDEAVFQPGYRWDALIAFPEAGDYCLTSGATSPAAKVNQTAEGAQILGFVHVEPGQAISGNSTDYVAGQLEAAAKVNMPASVRDSVVDDLKDGLKLTKFTPHRDIEDKELTGIQSLTFNIDLTNPNKLLFEVDGRPYDPNRIDRTLMLGGADEWTLRSAFVSHPFHIHVNPFQIVKILDPKGIDVSAPGAIDKIGTDTKGNDILDPEYPGLKGAWKDTLFVKFQYTVIVRSRYERYIGDFVLHCHILDHEDQGMMENVRIALPDGQGGAMMAQH
jgi:L-ascorbate oxidase